MKVIGMVELKELVHIICTSDLFNKWKRMEIIVKYSFGQKKLLSIVFQDVYVIKRWRSTRIFLYVMTMMWLKKAADVEEVSITQ